MLARADAGRLALDRQPHDLHALIEAAVEDARILAEGHALTFEITLPSFVEEFVDERYFTRILLNLLSNAVKYNRIGGTVRVDLAARENTWLLEIANTGRGIPPGHRAKLFERFFRSDDGSASPGHGLGLSLARELARAHAGDLVLFRASEVWSVFQLTLPRTISEPDLSALPLPEKVAPPVTLGTAVAITR